MDYVLHVESGYINFSPVGFKLVARDFRRCADTFKPFYCRAIELGPKAIHLETRKQQDVRYEYGHNLISSYKGSAA